MDSRARFYGFMIFLLMIALTLILPYHIRILVDLIATGYSDTKLLSFPVFGLITAFFYFSENNVGKKRVKTTIVLACMAVLYAAGIVYYIQITKLAGVEDYMTYITVRDGFLSSNQLTHIHSFKPVIGWFLEKTPEMSYLFDYGYAFMAYLPYYAYTPFTILLLYLTYLLVKLIGQMGSDFNHSISSLLLLTTSLFCVIKNIIDGGLLNSQLTIPLAVFAYLALYKSGRKEINNIGILVILILFTGLVQFLSQIMAVAYLNNGLNSDMTYFILELMISEKNIYNTAALLATAYLSFRPLDSKPDLTKLIASILIFTVLLAFLIQVSRHYAWSRSSITYSTYILDNAAETLEAGTPFAFLAKNGSRHEANFFRQTHTEQVYRYEVVWGILNSTVTGAQAINAGGTPAGRRGWKTDCEFNNSRQETAIYFKLYGFEPDVLSINSSLFSMEESERRPGEYEAEIKECMPSEQVILLDVLSQRDSTFAAELIGPSTTF